MYAIINAGGQQHKVVPGETIRMQKVGPAEEKDITFNEVMLIARDNDIIIGEPYIKNAAVKAEMVSNEKAAKVIVYKKKPRKGYERLRGHRQPYSVVKIKDIVFGG